MIVQYVDGIMHSGRRNVRCTVGVVPFGPQHFKTSN